MYFIIYLFQYILYYNEPIRELGTRHMQRVRHISPYFVDRYRDTTKCDDPALAYVQTPDVQPDPHSFSRSPEATMVINVTPSPSGDEADQPGNSQDENPMAEPTTPFATRPKDQEPCAEPSPTCERSADSPAIPSPVTYARSLQNEKVWAKFEKDKEGELHMTSWKPRSSQDVRQ